MKSTLYPWVATLLLSAPQAFGADHVEREILIRLKHPQNSIQQAVKSVAALRTHSIGSHQLERAQTWLNTQAKASLTGASALPSKFPVQIVNGEEGVLKLRLPKGASLESVERDLLANDEVINVSVNQLYRPALRGSFKKVEPNEAASLSLSFAHALKGAGFSTSESSVAGVTLPDVRQPGASGKGADPLLAGDWAMNAIGMSNADWRITKGKASITTAVIDTGVDYNHEDLIAGMWRKSDNRSEVGYDFAHNHAKPYDLRVFDVEGCMKDYDCATGADQSRFLANPGHGTHCAGHVAAVADNALGMRGVAAGSKMMALKFFFDAGEPDGGAGSDEGAIKSIDYAIKNGAKVINASWGGNQPRHLAEKSELKQALLRAQNAGVLVVIAAGNDGRDNDNDSMPNFPASFELDNIITVAATDSQDQLAEFSAYGLRTVHIGAPGVKILSTIAGGGYSDVVARFKDGDGQEQSMDWDGTSMAAPMVAGAAAAIWSKNPTSTYKQVRERILSTARKVPALEGRVASGGILNLKAALAN